LKGGLILPSRLDLELSTAAHKLIRDQIKVSPGESVLITTDSISDFRVAEEIAKAAESAGGKVMLAWHSTPEGYGQVTEAYLPEPLIACIPNTDVWIELNSQWLLYSTPWNKAVTNGRTRQVMLGGLSVDQLVRCIGKIDIRAQKEFQDKVVALTREARRMRLTNDAGTDVVFENDPKRPITNEIMYDTPGGHFLLGQIGWAPLESTINGMIAFDGAISGGGEAELGVLDEVITYVVEEGTIRDIRGGAKANLIKRWFEKLADPNMYIAAHVCYGFNPGARLEGTTTEDERVWGSTEWGFGYQGPMYSGGAAREAISHIDGVCLDCSVWLDERQLLDRGRVVWPEVAELARRLGRG
jgi:leucyl aminopeptidase (aminopeptidase T)